MGNNIENAWYMFGVIGGILVSILIIMIIGKKFNKDGKARTEYDERQQVIRGIGYKYAFWTMSIAIGIITVLSSFDIVIPADPFVVNFSVFILGGTVLMVYAIWNNAYWGLNSKPKEYTIFFGIMGLVNLGVGILAYKEGRMIKDGMLTHNFTSILCAMLLFVAMITLALKAIKDKKEAADEES